MFLNQHKDQPKPGSIAGFSAPHWRRFALAVLLWIMGAVPSVMAQDAPIEAGEPASEPWGAQIHVALSTLGGNGLQAGVLSARTVYTREVMVLADLDPLWRETDRRARVVLMPGMSIRLFGFERLIGGAAYRGFDIDLGLRAGPGLSFDMDESVEERNRRFELVIEPFLRLTSARSGRVAWLLEMGSTRPAFRFGLWWAY